MSRPRRRPSLVDLEREVLRVALELHRLPADTNDWETAFEKFWSARDAYVKRLDEGGNFPEIARELLWWAVEMKRADLDDKRWDVANEQFWKILLVYGTAFERKKTGPRPVVRDKLAQLVGVPSESLRDGATRYAALKRVGVCTKCRRRKAIPGKSRCTRCFEYQHDLDKRRADRRRLTSRRASS